MLKLFATLMTTAATARACAMPPGSAAPGPLAPGQAAGKAAGAPGAAGAHGTVRPSADVLTQLAPTGRLRAGMNLGNTLFTRRNAATGELGGVSVDIMGELAVRLGVPLELVVHATPGQVADAADLGTWDVAILAIEQARARTIHFSPPMTGIEATYLVHGDSPLQAASQVDTTGVRIAALEKAGYELFLTRTLRHATLIRTQSQAGSIELFNARGADAIAGLKPALLDDLARLPSARLLEGTFMTVNHGLGTPRLRGDAGAAYLQGFVEDMARSGFIARSVERHAVKGLTAIRS